MNNTLTMTSRYLDMAEELVKNQDEKVRLLNENDELKKKIKILIEEIEHIKKYNDNRLTFYLTQYDNLKREFDDFKRQLVQSNFTTTYLDEQLLLDV